MSPRNVLLVVLDDVPESQLRETLTERNGELNVHVVAPATHVGKFEWLTGATDEARADAEELAQRTADVVDAEVETEVGEHDPVLAAQDALALFPADEILLAGTTDEKTEAGLRGLGLPISRVGGGRVGGEGASEAEIVAHDVAEGRRDETPFIVVGTVAVFIFAVIALVSVIAFLVFWLA
jgi:hypothetical protein